MALQVNAFGVLAAMFGAASIIRQLLASTALAVLLSSANAQVRVAADLDVRPYLLNPSLGAPAAQARPDQKAPAEVERSRELHDGVRPPVTPPASVASQSTQQIERVPVRYIAQGDADDWSLISFLQGAFVALCAALAAIVLVPLIDYLLEAPTDADTMADPFGASSGLNVEELLQTELQPKDIRAQTDVLRAMKEALEADLESVRAQIERARAGAQSPETGEKP